MFKQKTVPSQQRSAGNGYDEGRRDALAGGADRGRSRHDLQGLRHPNDHPRPDASHHQRPGGKAATNPR